MLCFVLYQSHLRNGGAPHRVPLATFKKLRSSNPGLGFGVAAAVRMAYSRSDESNPSLMTMEQNVQRRRRYSLKVR